MVKVDIKELRDALKVAAKIVEKKSSVPVLQSVLLHTQAHGRGTDLVITATNLETSAEISIPVDGNLRIRGAVVNFAALEKTVRGAGKLENIGFDFDADNKLNAVIGRGSYPFDNSIEREDFPMLPDLSQIDVDGAQLYSAPCLIDSLAKVVPAMSDDDMRRSLYGVFFDAARDSLVATDGHRLHSITLDQTGFKTDSLIIADAIPAITEACKLTAKQAGTTCRQVLITRRGKFMVFSPSVHRNLRLDYKIISRVADAEFPDYMQVVPRDADMLYRLEIAGGDLAESCGRMARLGDLIDGCDGGGVYLAVNGSLDITDKAGAREAIATDGDKVNPELTFGINLKHLAGAAALGGDRIKVGIIGEKRPVVFESAGTRVITMPLDLPATTR